MLVSALIQAIAMSMSLVYLAVVASVIGFGVYLKLVGNIGADKASYVNIFTPTIALLLSNSV
jgi:drug/metabolite transporter (DMT)-like permease